MPSKALADLGSHSFSALLLVVVMVLQHVDKTVITVYSGPARSMCLLQCCLIENGTCMHTQVALEAAGGGGRARLCHGRAVVQRRVRLALQAPAGPGAAMRAPPALCRQPPLMCPPICLHMPLIPYMETC